MLEVSRQGKKILIAIDEDMLSNEYFLEFLERMKLEDIARKSRLTEDDAMTIANEMKEDWWQKNKSELLKGIDD